MLRNQFLILNTIKLLGQYINQQCFFKDHKLKSKVYDKKTTKEG